jgi:hypothetical protein
MQDLEADGVIKRNIPFSSGQGSKDRISPRLSNVSGALPSLKMSPSLSSIQTAKSIILNNPFASKHRSLAPPSMRDSTTKLSMKLRKIKPDHEFQKRMIVA